MSHAQVLSCHRERGRVMQEVSGRQNLPDYARILSFGMHQEQLAMYQTVKGAIKAASLPGSHTLKAARLACMSPAFPRQLYPSQQGCSGV